MRCVACFVLVGGLGCYGSWRLTDDFYCQYCYHNEMPGCVVVFELYDWGIMLYGYYTERLPVIPLQNVQIVDPGFYALTTIPRKYMLTGYKSVAT